MELSHGEPRAEKPAPEPGSAGAVGFSESVLGGVNCDWRTPWRRVAGPRKQPTCQPTFVCKASDLKPTSEDCSLGFCSQFSPDMARNKKPNKAFDAQCPTRQLACCLPSPKTSENQTCDRPTDRPYHDLLTPSSHCPAGVLSNPSRPSAVAPTVRIANFAQGRGEDCSGRGCLDLTGR